MKRIMTILAVLVLVGAVAVPVMAWYPGWGRGHHMMGYWGNGPEYGRDYGNLTSEQRSKLNALDRKFYDETTDLQNQIWAKSRELDSVLGSSNPDLEKANSLQKEISELRAKMDEKSLGYDLEARKIIPEDQFGGAYGGWYGHHMGPYGHGMGYGPGYCWN
ncbi:MAG: periplasmic heavy metal sensor [Deltaproteobacteria bacterium]|jgi:Spy/CpxP family protein refolding chaperone